MKLHNNNRTVYTMQKKKFIRHIFFLKFICSFFSHLSICTQALQKYFRAVLTPCSLDPDPSKMLFYLNTFFKTCLIYIDITIILKFKRNKCLKIVKIKIKFH